MKFLAIVFSLILGVAFLIQNIVEEHEYRKWKKRNQEEEL